MGCKKVKTVLISSLVAKQDKKKTSQKADWSFGYFSKYIILNKQKQFLLSLLDQPTSLHLMK